MFKSERTVGSVISRVAICSLGEHKVVGSEDDSLLLSGLLGCLAV